MNQNQSDNTPFEGLPEAERGQKIQSLREMVQSAEKTIQSAKAMLLQLEGKKKMEAASFLNGAHLSDHVLFK